jgi:tetratricopeptide (TPR) repeat protein
MPDKELSPEECPQAIVDAERLASTGSLQDAAKLYHAICAAYTQSNKKKEVAEPASRLAELYEQMGQAGTAIELHKLAYGINPANPTTLSRYAKFLYNAKEIAEASKMFRSLLLVRLGPEAPITKAEIYLYLGNLSLLETPPNKHRALEMFKRGLEFEPENAALKEAIERANRGEIPKPETPRAVTPEPKPPLQHFSQEATMKQSRTCPKCRHNRILYIDQVADQTGNQGYLLEQGTEAEPKVQSSLPWRIARSENPNKSFWSVGIITAGLVEAYVCRGCGYTELYTKDPSQIPVDGKYVQELVGPEVKDPYR